MEATPGTFQVLGTRIRKRRMQMGLEVRELAEKTGISRRYLSHLENGTRIHMRPRRYTVLRAALDVTDDYLLAPLGAEPDKE